MEGIHVAIAPEILGSFFGVPLTNTLVTSWLVVLLLAVFAMTMKRRTALLPGKFQLGIEMLFGGVYDYVVETLDSKDLAKKIFPLLMTVFLFVFIANVSEFVPGVGALTYAHGEGHAAPVFRSVHSDLNMTLALAILAFLLIEVVGISMLGFKKYAGKFINVHSIGGFLLGLLELISETMRLVSFSFRLFGNIFAGAVLISVIMFFAPYVVPVPFIAFELFVALMQAAILSLLTLFFVKIAITEHSH